jgi:hypothetical protein
VRISLGVFDQVLAKVVDSRLGGPGKEDSARRGEMQELIEIPEIAVVVQTIAVWQFDLVTIRFYLCGHYGLPALRADPKTR